MATLKNSVFLVLVGVGLAVLGSMVFRAAVEKNTRDAQRIDTVVVERIDTVLVTNVETRVQRVEVVRVDTVWLERVGNPDTLHRDSIGVVLPIERKVYADSLFRAVVSGYRPRLASLTLYSRERTIFVPVVAPSSVWSINAGAQMGYGITPKGALPYAGIGVSVGIRIGKKTHKKNGTNY